MYEADSVDRRERQSSNEVTPKHVALQTQLGDLGQATMMRQIDLWGERIIPAIRRELGPDFAKPPVFAAAAE